MKTVVRKINIYKPEINFIPQIKHYKYISV